MNEIRLRKERLEKGWTMEYVAIQLGISKAAVSYLEKGKSQPSYETLIKLEDLFGVSHRELFKEIEG